MAPRPARGWVRRAWVSSREVEALVSPFPRWGAPNAGGTQAGPSGSEVGPLATSFPGLGALAPRGRLRAACARSGSRGGQGPAPPSTLSPSNQNVQITRKVEFPEALRKGALVSSPVAQL